MVRKLSIATIVLGIAAFSPAPVNSSQVGTVKLTPQTQAQLAAQQKFNGTMPVVGQVQKVTNEVGGTRFDAKPMTVSHQGDRSVQYGSLKVDKVGMSAISIATSRVAAEESQGKYGWFYAILICLAGFLGWKLFQYKVERATPLPKFSKRMLRDIESGRL